MMSYLVWVVRLVLPILFFVIWHSLQPAKEKPQPTGNRHARIALLRQRKETLGQAAPASIKNIRLVEDSLVNTGGPREKRGGLRERGGDRIDRASESPEERRVRREAREERKRVKDASGPRRAKDSEDISRQDKMHLECLMNYIAFSRRHRPQAGFLPDGGPAPAEEEDAGAPEPARTNSEVQMVLKGLAHDRSGVRCAILARDLHDRLVEAKVDVDEPTFILMIEACIRAEDLTAVSDFLQKMETSGFCPPSALLDKVMDLYSAHKGLEPVTSPAPDPIIFVPEGAGKIPSGAAFAADFVPGERWADDDSSAMPVAVTSWGEPVASAFNFDAYSDEDD